MEFRTFGRTGMQFSLLGFGCGAVGGLMVRGDAGDQERTVARAIDAGVNYFDTAVLYGDGEFGKEPRPRFAEAETCQCGRRHQGPGAARRDSAALTMPSGHRSKAACCGFGLTG